MDAERLIRDLRRYMNHDVPTPIALKALKMAEIEMPPGGGPGWLIQRAAYLIRRAR